MKKLFILLVLSVIVTTTTYAQSDLVATLSHDGQTTAFYGANALAEAHAVCADGDVITLSNGTFNGTIIDKCITLRGAGMFENTTTQVTPTTIAGDMLFRDCQGSVGSLTVEGLCFKNKVLFGGTMDNPLFIKTIFLSDVTTYASAPPALINPTYIHCFAKGGFLDKGNNTFINCVLGSVSFGNDDYNQTFNNCVVISNENGGWYSKNCAFTNCILVCTHSGITNPIASSCSAYNCVALYAGTLGTNVNSGQIPIFASIGNATNKEMNGNGSLIFKSYVNTFNAGETFELTDEAASTYLGTDGTQVGIYGGELPFDPTPSNPQVTKFEVENSTANGKLTVKINVE